MLYQPTNITPDELNGTGVVDISGGLEVCWWVTGTRAMTAYMVQIYSNAASPVLLYSTGRCSPEEPFWGTDCRGEPVTFSVTIPAADLTQAGIVNGGEYRLVITQWWSAARSVAQAAPSVFRTRSAPVLELTNLPAVLPGRSFSFTAGYTQAQGDGLNWVRWQVAVDDLRDSPFIDTGCIFHPGELRCDGEGFVPEGRYALRCRVQTAEGVEADTGWHSFQAPAPTEEIADRLTACWDSARECMVLQWTDFQPLQGLCLFRRRVGEEMMESLVQVGAGVAGVLDWGCRSGESYIYYAFPFAGAGWLTGAWVSGQVSARRRCWTLLEAEETDGGLVPQEIYRFRLGDGGVTLGRFSNGNSPQLLGNFTAYPLRQASPECALSGSLTAYIGTVGMQQIDSGESLYGYRDTAEEIEALTALSISDRVLFLADPKGRLLRVHTASPVTFTMDPRSPALPQCVTLPWTEVGSAAGAMLTTVSGVRPAYDPVVFTSLQVDMETGELLWNREADYGPGSVLTLEDGGLVQTVGTGFRPATLTITGGVLQGEFL